MKFSLVLSAFLLGGCTLASSSKEEPEPQEETPNNDDVTTKTNKRVLSANEILVERSSPLVNAIVIDSNGKTAIEREGGIYRFKNSPLHPVYVFSGAVNFNLNGKITVGDVKNSLMLGASRYRVATIVTTLAFYDDKRAWLKESFGLSDAQIDKQIPRQNKTIAAISDEVLKYCIENSLHKPSKIIIDDLYALESAILTRIELYTQSEKTSDVLEKELIETLEIPLVNSEDVEYYKNGSSNPLIVVEQLPKYPLNDEQKYALAFMWNEERLAGDAYGAFYAVLYDSLNDQEKVLADRVLKVIEAAERLHEQAVEALIKKYDIDILNLEEYDKTYNEVELREMPAGVYPIKKLQEIWDNVAPIGTKDLISAFKIGCITEVGDVEDLDRYIKIAGDAVDLRYVLEFLRDGSILHYWAFDRALKELGITDGACDISSRYCKRRGEFEINGDGGTHLDILAWVEK